MELYFIAFFEGFINFVSPCILPVLPALIAYVLKTGTSANDKKLQNLLFFVLGFTIVFVSLGVLASSLGMAVAKNLLYINIIFGVISIILSLNYLGVYNIKALNKEYEIKNKEELKKTLTEDKKTKFKVLRNSLESLIMGIFFALVWTPCTGPFLASALIKAVNIGSQLEGGILLFIYSLGITIPLVLSSLMLNKLTKVFTYIKKHYNMVKIISGGILLCYGLYLIISNLITILS